MDYFYNLCTTEMYRLKREADKLDGVIEEQRDELKKLEFLIAKKKELKRKLPEVPSDASGSSAPPAAASEPRQSSGSSAKVQCEVHTQPPPRQPSGPSSFSASCGK